MQDQEMATITINLNERESGEINESFLLMFGTWAKTLLRGLFGGKEVPVNVKGSPSQVRSFANALGSEKRYLEAWRDQGLDNPMTYKRKGELDKAIRKFTSKTGIPWPFK